MGLSDITPDQVVYWEWSFVRLNATIVYTWAVMALLLGLSWLATRRIREDRLPDGWQNALEAILDYGRRELGALSGQDPDRYLPFVGTLFLFLAVSNALTVLPIWEAPTGSLSTTTALALCVFVAVPVFGIASDGLRGYLRHYVQPSPLMLPLHVLGELSRTLALAVRLFGNVMSGTKIVAILLALVPLFFPIVMRLLGLLTGLVQAYIFAVLAMVYIASGMRAHEAESAQSRQDGPPSDEKGA